MFPRFNNSNTSTNVFYHVTGQSQPGCYVPGGNRCMSYVGGEFEVVLDISAFHILIMRPTNR